MVVPSLPHDPRDALDGIDRRLLLALERNARLTNAALAKAAGIAESTCTQRLRSLRDRGVIRGFRAEVDPAAAGRPMQAVIKVRLGSHDRDGVLAFHERLTRIPGVIRIFHVAGADDYLLHVAVATAEALRDLVLEHITQHPGVVHTETQLVFEVLDGPGALAEPAGVRS
ncbi:DNA-binding Lrp family transcriptional regulator [Microcella putealis]|uniref:DNA-binding Lrp family transcriptional regulator n=1 Tax=Microcella putealis TaxID=337005 RepID=A0A4Q7LW58_9MICO|nr:Lrp/AsnC family transcriptional regulator [Microcella putealis]RZS58951.1 DNA-binding Lrp family transcriptional regulator [Microcella putealis]TQM23977.1 AsnC family transcriptional regulator [Microcella putealis]